MAGSRSRWLQPTFTIDLVHPGTAIGGARAVHLLRPPAVSFLFPSSTITFEAALRDLAQGSPKARAAAAQALGDVEDPTVSGSGRDDGRAFRLGSSDQSVITNARACASNVLRRASLGGSTV